MTGAQSIKAGAQSVGKNIATGVRGAASVASDVVKDIAKYSPIK